MILEGTNGKRLSCRKINKFADLFITNMTVDKFNSYAQVGMPCSKTKAEIENVEKTKVRLTAPGDLSVDWTTFTLTMCCLCSLGVFTFVGTGVTIFVYVH